MSVSWHPICGPAADSEWQQLNQQLLILAEHETLLSPQTLLTLEPFIVLNLGTLLTHNPAGPGPLTTHDPVDTEPC